jgi:hypothetical protein
MAMENPMFSSGLMADCTNIPPIQTPCTSLVAIASGVVGAAGYIGSALVNGVVLCDSGDLFIL